MNVKICNAIKKKKTVTYDARPDLYASKCDLCKKIFGMQAYCNDKYVAALHGTFDKSAADKDGRSMGNMFSATVCSFECADKLFKGGWKYMNEYKPYIKVNAILVRAECYLTALLQTEKELIKEWKEKEELEPGKFWG